MSNEDFTEEFPIEKPAKKPLNSKKQEIRTTGVCGKCNKRYTDVPVIDGVSQCPNCVK